MQTRKTLAATMESVGERQIRVRCSTDGVDRAGDIVVQTGADLTGYQSNPIMLWQHNPDVPVARAVDCGLVGGVLEATAEFPPAGVSPKADEICGLAKAGIINAVSIGFNAIESEPIDPKRPRGPQRFLTWDLMEISFVSVPANRDALVIARQINQRGNPMRLKIKGMYGVGQLAGLLANLGWLQLDSEWEADMEDDASKVPAMLGAAMRQLGDALIAMTQEEVAELLADLDTPDVEIVDDDYVLAGATPAVQRFRRGVLATKVRLVPVVKAGKTLSAATKKTLQGALAKHAEAADMHEKAAGMSAEAVGIVKSMLDQDDTVDPDANEDDPGEGDDPTTESAAADADAKLSRAARMKAVRLLAVSPA